MSRRTSGSACTKRCSLRLARGAEQRVAGQRLAGRGLSSAGSWPCGRRMKASAFTSPSGALVMFDIDTQIQEWRRTVAVHFGDRGDVVDELEAHLRDDLDRRIRSGVAPEQAWADACAQLGDARQLAGEFAKVGGRRAWVPAWIAAIAVIATGLFAVVWVSIRLRNGRGDPLLACHVV